MNTLPTPSKSSTLSGTESENSSHNHLGAPAVDMHNLTFSYNGSPVLEDVCLAIAPDDFTCLVGPNGGGKSTLLKLILGLLRPNKGTIRVFFVRIALSFPQVQRKILSRTGEAAIRKKVKKGSR